MAVFQISGNFLRGRRHVWIVHALWVCLALMPATAVGAANVLSIGDSTDAAREVLMSHGAVVLNENRASDGRFYLAARLKNDTGLNLIFATTEFATTDSEEANPTEAEVAPSSDPLRLVQIETGRWQSNGISGLLQLERATVFTSDLDLDQVPPPPSGRNDALIGLAVLAAVITIVVIARRRAIQRMPERGGLESLPEHERDNARRSSRRPNEAEPTDRFDPQEGDAHAAEFDDD